MKYALIWGPDWKFQAVPLMALGETDLCGPEYVSKAAALNGAINIMCDEREKLTYAIRKAQKRQRREDRRVSNRDA